MDWLFLMATFMLKSIFQYLTGTTLPPRASEEGHLGNGLGEGKNDSPECQSRLSQGALGEFVCTHLCCDSSFYFQIM